MTKKINKIMIASLVLTAGAVLADNINGIDIDFVNIGDAGYAADDTGYGAVADNYRIGRTEVTIEQFSASGVGGATGAAGTPAVNVSWHEAAQFANWLTSSNATLGAYTISGGLVTAIDRASAVSTYGTVYVLPTNNEWYKAAYFTGSGYSDYANGTDVAPVAGTDANYLTGVSPWVVGSGSTELNNGTEDMMGNVWEWTESPDDVWVNDRQIAGGAFDSPDQWIRSRDDFTQLSPGSQTPLIGFRVAAIPEPGTISLMSLSTLSLFATRRIRRRKLAGKSLLPIGREHVCDSFEGNATYGEMEGTDYLVELKTVAHAYLFSAWDRVHARYMTFDKLFWNRMVARHERRVARKAAFKVALKKRVLDGFDSFLALIMK